ncbi:MAG: zinc ABC transporter substrate-binding protein [Gammaproteobacteria bacterium]|nr:zinc ABC transporter substrate-binding protein [Gammaproteobacteria bacterium]MBQ0840997.1 zinc ABC transporter substrate-binding protein [Gammaproteobacteria bacterium]
MFLQWKKTYSLAVLFLTLCSNTVYAQLNIFACEPEWAALTRTLAGDAATVYSATSAQQDPHHIQARPSLIAKVRRADMLVCTGAELEVGWLPLLLRKSGNANIQPGQAGYFMATDHVSLLEKPSVLDRSLGDIHAAGNPHIHLDPYRIQQVARALTSRLITVDPANKLHYREHLEGFSLEWAKAITQWEKQTQTLRGKRIVVAHNNWVYLEEWLGLKRVAVLEPKPGIPPSSSHLSKVLTQLKQNPADMIVHSSYQNDKPALWLAKKTSLPVVVLPFSGADKESLIHWFDRLLGQLLSADP